MPRLVNQLISLLLLIVFPLNSVYPHVRIPIVHSQYTLSEFTEDLNPDQLIKFLDAIEEGKMDNASDLEQAKIVHFITFLAEKGMVSSEDNSDLEEDIENLLQGKRNIFDDSSFQLREGRLALMASSDLFHYDLNWFSKRYRRLKNFLKKHKKALIIGAVVVVAAAAVVTAIIVSSSATAAASAAAAAAALDEVKEHAAAEGLLEEPAADCMPTDENTHLLSSVFAHAALDLLPENVSVPEDAHKRVDNSFGVNFAHLPNFNDVNFGELSYQMRGEYALSRGYLNQAVQDFGKVITLNPNHSLAYLERGIAHFELGNYQNSVDDYRQFSRQKEKLSIPEFSIGFAKGVPKGIYDSGEGLLLFISDIVSHPVDTSTQMWQSLNQLKNMVCSQEWALMAEVLSPEVYQLVTDWDYLPSVKRGELAGYALGKHGSDILLPGASVKLASSGIKYSQELCTILKNLQTVEQTLVLESVASLGSGAVIGERVQQARSILTLGEEVGLTTQELSHLKQAGTLETVVTEKAKHVFTDPALKASCELYKNAQITLKPYTKTYLPESRVRELIHQTGIRTFERPKGIPEDFLVRITNKGGGMEYVHPIDKGTTIRVMPGKPHSPLPYQQKPYVILSKANNNYDKFGNIVQWDDPIAHIPLEEFIYVK